MTSADFLTIVALVAILGAVSWVAYQAGRHKAEVQAQATVSHLRNHLRACSQRLERTSYELASLREALRDQRLRDVAPPAWLEGQDG